MDGGYSECRLAAAYIRVSTDDQIELSPDSQLEEIQKYARNNNIILLEDCIFIDAGISGKKADNRPEFMKMISLAKSSSCPFSVILLWKYSRFARNQEESIFYKSILRSKCHVDVISVTEPLISGPFGSLIERIIEWMDEFYSIRLSQEVKRSMTVNAERGVYQSTPPLGYTMDKKKLVTVDSEAEVIRIIFNDFNNGENIFSIAKKINAMGIRTHRGNTFEYRTIEYILRNPVYIGKVRWNPTGPTKRNFNDKKLIIADGSHEALIDIDTWNKAQERLNKIKQLWGYKARTPNELRSWAIGLVRCKECGSTLTFQAPHYFKCSGYVRAKCNYSQHIRSDYLEEAIISRLEQDTMSDTKLTFTIEASSNKKIDSISSLESQLRSISTKLTRMQNAYMNAVIELDEYAKVKRTLTSNYDKVKAELERALNASDHDQLERSLKNRLQAALDTLRNSDVSNDQKRTAAKSIIESCTFDKSKNLLTIVYRLRI